MGAKFLITQLLNIKTKDQRIAPKTPLANIIRIFGSIMDCKMNEIANPNRGKK